MLYVALWADSLTDALRQRMALELIPYEQSEEWKALLMFWSRFPRRLRDLSSLNFFQSVAVNCVLQSCKVRIAARAFRKRFAFRWTTFHKDGTSFVCGSSNCTSKSDNVRRPQPFNDLWGSRAREVSICCWPWSCGSNQRQFKGPQKWWHHEATNLNIYLSIYSIICMFFSQLHIFPGESLQNVSVPFLFWPRWLWVVFTHWRLVMFQFWLLWWCQL